MAFVLENAKRRRLVGKQRAPALWVLPPATLAALADEARSEVVAVVAVNPPEKKLDGIRGERGGGTVYT